MNGTICGGLPLLISVKRHTNDASSSCDIPLSLVDPIQGLPEKVGISYQSGGGLEVIPFFP